MSNLQVLLFAGARELVGEDLMILDVDLPILAADLLTAIGRAEPKLIPWLGSSRLAINQGFVPGHYVVKGDEEIALIPPVSGG